MNLMWADPVATRARHVCLRGHPRFDQDGAASPVEPTAAEWSPAGTGVLAAGSARGRWVLLAAVLGSALASVDSTVVGIALPAIGRDLQGSFTQLQWVVTGYTLTLASLILLSGAAGDRYGRAGCSCSARSGSPWRRCVARSHRPSPC